MDSVILASIEQKLDRIDQKLEGHLERLTRVEEQQKTFKGILSFLATTCVSMLGWWVYKRNSSN